MRFTRCILIFLLLISPSAWASINVAVLYPHIEGGYSAVFDNIISGVENNPGITVNKKALSDDTGHEEVSAWLEQSKANVLLALGRRSYDIANGFSDQLPVVHGGLVLSPNGHTGVSLAGDPEQFFKRLSILAPHVKRVLVVYSEHSSGWLVRMAEKSAPNYGYELVSYKADDIREAVHIYQRVLDDAKEGDSLWLPLDSVSPDKAVLPLVLREAWDRRLVVFSNNPQHARKGALFSLYPDNRMLGEQLAALALKVSDGSEPLVLPTLHMKLSVNRRTASHLRVDINQGSKLVVDQIYPVR